MQRNLLGLFILGIQHEINIQKSTSVIDHVNRIKEKYIIQ